MRKCWSGPSKCGRDLNATSQLRFEFLDEFAELAPVVYRLYRQVVAKPKAKLEVLDEQFFEAISTVDGARLLVGRDLQTREVLGANLLLFGERQMQNLYIGFDHART